MSDTITVTTTANQSFTLQLSGSYDAGARVDLISDGNGGTELFLDNSTIIGTTAPTVVLITGNFVISARRECLHIRTAGVRRSRPRQLDSCRLFIDDPNRRYFRPARTENFADTVVV